MLLLLVLSACGGEVKEAEERGDRFSATGDYVDAQVEYELALEEAGPRSSGRLQVKAGALALRAKEFGSAGRILGRLVDDDPAAWPRVRALYELQAHRSYARGDTFAALRAIDWLVERDSTIALGPLYYVLGDAYYARPDYDAALAAYVLGLAQAPGLAPREVDARLGDAFERRRDCVIAIRYFRRYMETTPDAVDAVGDARYRLGTCALRLAERAFAEGDLIGARENAELMLRTGEPAGRIDDAELLMGRVSERRGDREAAMRRYQRIVNRSGETRTRTTLEALRRLKQLEFGFPLERPDDGGGGSDPPSAVRPGSAR